MEPKSLSATAVEAFEGCPARYRAEMIERAPQQVSAAARLGSSCHDALEHWVADDHYLDDDATFETLTGLYEEAYWGYFASSDFYDAGIEMLERWFNRQDWNDRTVVSTERKEQFQLPTKYGDIGVTYIFDRLDIIGDTEDPREIEVVDYKTWIMPVKSEDLRHKLQARIYALAAKLLYPNAEEIWVTMDQLRYDSVGYCFSRDDCVETWKYLKKVYERIRESEGTEEVINPQCRWCIRTTGCETFLNNAASGGVMSVNTFDEALERAATLDSFMKAAKLELDELKDYILNQMAEREEREAATDNIKVKITGRNVRVVDPVRVNKIIGPKILQRYAKLGMGQIDEILKSELLKPEDASTLKGMIRQVPGNPGLRFDIRHGLDGADE